MMSVIPSDLELLSFFESDPINTWKEDGYICYEIQAEQGVRYLVSFDGVARSLQITIVAGEHNLITISSELLKNITILRDKLGEYLQADFQINGTSTTAKLRIHPKPSVVWSSIET